MSNFATSIDVRTLERGSKKDIIFEAFEKLNLDEKMELINDHDPRPLYKYFMSKVPEKFKWEYLEQGPEVWRIVITKK